MATTTMGVTKIVVETPTEVTIVGTTMTMGEEMTMEMMRGTATTTRTTAAAARRKEHVKNLDTTFLIVAPEKTLKHARKLQK